MFTPRPIGHISSPYKTTHEIPKGPGAKHEAEGALNLLPEFAEGLLDIEGFSHLFVIWEFDKSDGYDLIAHPPTDERRPHGAPPESERPDGGRIARSRRRVTARARRRHARRHAHPRHQALHVEHPG